MCILVGPKRTEVRARPFPIARHTSRPRRALCVPRSSNNCPRAAPMLLKLPKFGQVWPIWGVFWPTSDQLRPKCKGVLERLYTERVLPNDEHVVDVNYSHGVERLVLS